MIRQLENADPRSTQLKIPSKLLQVEHESIKFTIEPTWVAFVYALRFKFFHVEKYDDHYMIWATLCQYRDQIVLEYNNAVHALY